MKIFGRRDKIWIISRIGILICFGIMPLMTIHERLKWVKYDEYDAKFWQCATNHDLEGENYWLQKSHEEFTRITGRKP